jgi:hypothetical protein
MKNWRGAGKSGVRAERLTLRPWADLRLLVGVLLVLGATVVGARLVAANDDTVEYWSVAADVQTGDPLSSEQLVATRVRLDQTTASQYLRVAADLPAAVADLQWDHDVSAGALLDVAALVRRDRDTVRQLPITVVEGASPQDLSRGDLVEVWAAPTSAASDDLQPSTRVLGPVRVLQAGADAGSVGGSLARTILVEVSASTLTGEVVSTVGSGRVTIVRLS